MRVSQSTTRVGGRTWRRDMSRPLKGELDPQLREVLKETLDAMDRLLSLFRVERMLHLGMGVLGFLLLVYAIVLLFRQSGVVPTELLVALFGSGGLIAVSSARITFFFNKAFKLVEDIVRSLIRTGETNG
jgi:hypothetical protein